MEKLILIGSLPLNGQQETLKRMGAETEYLSMTKAGETPSEKIRLGIGIIANPTPVLKKCLQPLFWAKTVVFCKDNGYAPCLLFGWFNKRDSIDYFISKAKHFLIPGGQFYFFINQLLFHLDEKGNLSCLNSPEKSDSYQIKPYKQNFREWLAERNERREWEKAVKKNTQ